MFWTKLKPGRRDYWLATAALMTAGTLASEKGFLSNVIFFAWLALYVARLRDAGRSLFAMLHLLGCFALIFIAAIFASNAFLKYFSIAEPGQAVSIAESIIFFVCIGSAIPYFLWFSIWLGCIKTGATSASPTAVADTFA